MEKLIVTVPNRTKNINVSYSFKNLYCNKLVKLLVSLPVFLSEPSAAGSYNWPPAPLGCNLANAGNTKQWRTAVKESSFFFMIIYYQSQSRIHRSTITTVTRLLGTGSEEPERRAK
jgi:hypothetical protein